LPSPDPDRPGAVPWRATAEGVELAVRLTPRGGAAGIDGVADAGGRPVLKVRVAAPPVDNAANAALIVFLSDALAIPKSAIRLTGGGRARIKILRISGPDLPARLAALLG
jgi:uncharacterized protein YggU (UPF0235/DUF167 family)